MGEDKVIQWEYRIQNNYSPSPSLKTLTVFGNEGWELVAIIPGDNESAMWILYFKRAKPLTPQTP